MILIKFCEFAPQCVMAIYLSALNLVKHQLLAIARIQSLVSKKQTRNVMRLNRIGIPHHFHKAMLQASRLVIVLESRPSGYVAAALFAATRDVDVTEAKTGPFDNSPFDSLSESREQKRGQRWF